VFFNKITIECTVIKRCIKVYSFLLKTFADLELRALNQFNQEAGFSKKFQYHAMVNLKYSQPGIQPE